MTFKGGFLRGGEESPERRLTREMRSSSQADTEQFKEKNGAFGDWEKGFASGTPLNPGKMKNT